jgi:hypothetical protein
LNNDEWDELENQNVEIEENIKKNSRKEWNKKKSKPSGLNFS